MIVVILLSVGCVAVCVYQASEGVKECNERKEAAHIRAKVNANKNKFN